jgi:biotin synthase
MKSEIKHNWSYEEAEKIFNQPFNDLLFQAQTIHRKYFNPNKIQISMLLSIKTGACPEDCKYCSQSAHYSTEAEKEKLTAVQKVIESAKIAKESGASRFCMGAAWRNPSKRDMPYVIEMVKEVKALGLETCMTLGKLSEEQAGELAEAGLDYYNHNLDTSPEFYGQIITTRTYEDRLQTISEVRKAGIKVCCGGILGLGETRKDRINLLVQLANLQEHPESVPINMLIKMKGTPLEQVKDLDPLEFIRTIATARIMMPKSYVRLSAGREKMNDEMQALSFFSGANSIFYGDKLLTASNPQLEKDQSLMERLGLQAEKKEDYEDGVHQAVIAESLISFNNIQGCS